MIRFILSLVSLCILISTYAFADVSQELIYNPGHLKPTDSSLKVAVGDKAPDFILPIVSGGTIQLSQFSGKKNVVLSFVPAAFTPVCSGQWPGYNLAKKYFDKYDAQIIGITEDNIPSLFAWTHQMGTLWFPVASDFWPHGKVADAYGLLRTDGMADRAIIIIDKKGIIRSIMVNDINTRPDLGAIMKQLEALEK